MVAPVSPAEVAAAPRPVSVPTVLVVEDQPGVRRLVARCFARLGYRVLEAESGASALALLQNDAMPQTSRLMPRRPRRC